MICRGEGNIIEKFDNTWFAWKWRIVGAVVGIIMAAPLYIMMANASTELAHVWHVEQKKVLVNQYVSEKRCQIRKIPVYGEHYHQHQQGSSAGDLLGAMVLGGIFGHAFSGNNDGAAAGAVLGALIQNDKSNNQQSGRFIAGYENREVCDYINVPRKVEKNKYIIHWKQYNKRGHFYSDKKYRVGETIYVNVN